MTRPLCLLVVALAVSGIGFAQKVQYNFDQEAEFANYKTYSWVDANEGEKLDELTDRQIRAALDAELAGKGLLKIESGGDLHIGYQVATSSEKRFTNTGWGYGPGWRYGRGGGISTTESATIAVGTVVLDIYDAGAKRLVWRGTATKTIEPASNPKKRQQRLAKAAKKLLKNYPPPKGR